MRERDQLIHPGIDGRTILRCMLEKWDESMDWNDVAEDRDR